MPLPGDMNYGGGSPQRPPADPVGVPQGHAVRSSATGSERRADERTLLTPPIDIYTTDEGLVLVADLPGVSLDSLDLQVQDNRLTLFGRCAPITTPGARLLHREFAEGDFLRSFILSDDVDHERISAKLVNGVLEVTLPKTTGNKPRRIQVNAE